MKISTTKVWHISSFSLENSDFKNVFFEKIPWAPSEIIKVKGGRMVKAHDFEAEKIQMIKKIKVSKLASMS